MESRTRDRLIEVARQLFANKGVENTTMSDIATASDKGRRTIYTYFKSKREIYEATIEHESECMVGHLRKVVMEASSPEKQLEVFLRHRLDMFETQATTSKGMGMSMSLDSLLHLDFNRIERVRRLAISKEKELLSDILDRGVADGSFDARQASLMMPVLQFVLQGVDLSIARNNFDEIDIDRSTYKEEIIKYLINSLLSNKLLQK